MKRIFIKSIESGTDFPKQTGMALCPEHIDCDEKLYTWVRQEGHIHIRRFKPNNPFELGDVEDIPADVFCSNWRGD